MTTFSDDELIDYLAGKVPPERCQAIAAQAAEDEELRAQLGIMAALGGLRLPQSSPLFQMPRRRRWHRAAAILVAATMFTAGAGWAAWYVLTPHALMEDDFNADWIDPNKWETARPTTVEEGGHLRLNNRGSVRTTKEFPGPVEIEFDWRWVDLVGDTLYRDTLTLVLHSSGEHAKAHPFRVTDGLEIAFQASSGQVNLASRADPRFIVGTAIGSTPMPAGKWHHIRIVDDGNTLTIFVSGAHLNPSRVNEPVLKTPYKSGFAKDHIVIHNREVVGGAIHESHIDSFVIRALSPSK